MAIQRHTYEPQQRYAALCAAVIEKRAKVDMASFDGVKIGKNHLLLERINSAPEIYSKITGQVTQFFHSPKNSGTEFMRAGLEASLDFERLEDV
jgi:hypothetical protein